MRDHLREVRDNIVIAALEKLATYQTIGCPGCLFEAIDAEYSNPLIRSLMASIALYRLPEAANDQSCNLNAGEFWHEP